MSDIQTKIKKAIEYYGITNTVITRDSEIIEWLTHQQKLIESQAKELEEREKTITSIRKQFEETDWGSENIELRERFNYWRELAGTRDNKISEQAKEIERIKAISEIATEALGKYSEMIVIDGEDRPQDVGQVAREALYEMRFVKGKGESQ